jgi:hypothetical protein
MLTVHSVDKYIKTTNGSKILLTGINVPILECSDAG